MPFFSMFFFMALLFMAVVLLAVWLVSLSFFITGRKKGSRPQMWFAGVPLFLITSLGVWIAYLFLAPPNPVIAYKDAFGAAPPRDVTELRSSEDTFGDYSVIHLKFKASPATVQRITAKGWQSNPADTDPNWDDDGIYYHDEDTPDWWRPQRTTATRVFYATKRLGHFSNFEEETLIYDTAAHQAFYYYHGLD